MSFELRLKKLRGSGGYVLANVDDAQQTKGNLGGPDLFLAPIGRIDTDRISKFFCNACEQEYIGAPSISYDSLNEEVAENLILVERGQYVCNTCNATLAEYREFRKRDEEIEVGVAKPIEPVAEVPVQRPQVQPQVQEPQAQPEPQVQPQVQEPQAQPEPQVQPQVQEPQAQPEPQVQEEPKQDSESISSGIRSIENMSVFDSNARIIGTVKQMGIDAAQNMILVVKKTDGSVQSISWNRIKNIGDVVFLAPEESPSADPPATPQPAAESPAKSMCSQCGSENIQGSKFCEQCGKPI